MDGRPVGCCRACGSRGGGRPKIPSSHCARSAGVARRYLAVLALGPFRVVALGAALTGRWAVAMWGSPLWPLLPLAALVWADPVIGGARLRVLARACLLVLLVVPAAYAADEL